MKNILIVSYLFPPNTSIVSSARPYSWFQEFSKSGIKPTAITRHWSDKPIQSIASLLEEDFSPPKEVIMNGNNVIYLPFRKSFLMKLYERLNKNTITRPGAMILKLLLLLAGIMTDEADIDYAFREYILDLIKKKKFDGVIITALPVSAVKLGYHIKTKTGLPVFMDFRDYWNMNLMNSKFRFSARARVYFYFQELYIKKWLKPINYVLSVCAPINEKIDLLSKASKIVIYNGFEKDIFQNIEPEPCNGKFNITIVGVLYPTQDIPFMIEGFKKFLAGKDLSDIRINFIGQKYFPDIAGMIAAALPQECVLMTNRIPRPEALKNLLSSQVLYYIGWLNYKGVYSGKIFEYLAAKKNILIAPNDKDVLEELILKTNSGKLADTTDEMSLILNKWYLEWKQNGTLKYNGDVNEIAKYTRENQAEIFARYLIEQL